jgi:sarcosine dehydrogenase
MGADRAVGSVAYTALCNERGGVMADLTFTKLSEEKFYIAAGGSTSTHDWRWISTQLEKSGYQASLRDATDEYCMISVQGPYSRQLLKGLVDVPIESDEYMPFSTCRHAKLAGHDLMILRLTFVGELGYEFHVPATSAVALYEALWAEGQKLAATGVRVANAGYRAIDSLSAEKNYRHWHADLSCRDTPFEAGIGFVALAKLKTDSPFLGREALEKHRAEGLRRRLVTIILDEQRPETPLHGRETIWRGDECVGYIRSTAFGFSIGKQIAYGYVDAPGREPLQPKQFTEWMNASSSWSIGDRCAHRPATVLKPGQAPFDPKNLRIKGEYPPEVYSQPGAYPQPREHLLDPLLPVS